MIEKIDQESEEYRKWKEGSVTVDIDDKNAEVSTEKTVDTSIDETATTSEEEQNPNLPEETIDNNQDSVTKKVFFFDWFFGVKNDRDRMKKTYYFIFFLVYYSACCLAGYDFQTYDGGSTNIFMILLVGLGFALFLPFILLIVGFTISGGAFIGIFVGIFSWIFGVIARFIY